MELLDIFAKYDLTVDAACKRNERMYYEICKEKNQEPDLKPEVAQAGRRGQANQQVDVKKWITTFKWDQVRFQMDKSLKILGQKIQATEKSCADRLKKKTDETNSIKAKLQQLSKRESKSFMQTDLEVIVYENKMKADSFINSHYAETQMTTVLVVVPKKKTDEFLSHYEELLLKFNTNDLANWEKRTTAQINMNH